MNAIRFLFAAYIATWVIHGVYLGSLVRRFSRLRQQMKEVKASGFRRSASGFPPQD
jgi:CcmD family protein